MKIKEIKYHKGYVIQVIYDNGQMNMFNLEPIIKEFVSKYGRFSELLDVNYFSTVRLNKNWNTVEWENGFDICPDYFQSLNNAA